MDNYHFQDQQSFNGYFYVNCFSDGEVSSNEAHAELRSWIFSIKEYSSGITAKYRSGLGISQSEESFLTGKCFLCSI